MYTRTLSNIVRLRIWCKILYNPLRPNTALFKQWYPWVGSRSSHDEADPVTLNKICVIILEFRSCGLNVFEQREKPECLHQANYSNCYFPMQRNLLCRLHSEYREVRHHPPSDPSGLTFSPATETTKLAKRVVIL